MILRTPAIQIALSLFLASSAAHSAPVKKPKKPKHSQEFVKFRASTIERIIALLDAGFKQAKIKNPKNFGVSEKSVRKKFSRSFHSEHALKHTVTDTATTITKIALSDWKNKSSQGLFDERIIFWGDGLRRQHAASIKIEWWIGEESTYKESYMRLSLDHMWVQDDPKNKMISYPLKPISRELTLNQPGSIPVKNINLKAKTKAAASKSPPPAKTN